MANNHLVWRCSNCDNHQSSIPRSEFVHKITLRCTRCGKSKKLKRQGELGLSTKIMICDDGIEAADMVAKLNAGVTRL